jgi:hypothetical protein
MPKLLLLSTILLLVGCCGDKLSELAYRLTDSYPQTQFYTSHCTGDAVFATLHQVMGDKIYAFSCGTTNNNKANKNEV